MFDKLVESAKEKQGRRARRLFLATGAVYAVALVALGVATIIGFNSALAEEYDIIGCMAPPVPPGPAPQQAPSQLNLKQAAAPRFEPPKEVKDPPKVEDIKVDFGGMRREMIAGAPPTSRFRGIRAPPPPPDPPPPPRPPHHVTTAHAPRPDTNPPPQTPLPHRRRKSSPGRRAPPRKGGCSEERSRHTL